MRALVVRDDHALTTASVVGTMVELFAGTAAVAAAVAGLSGHDAWAMAGWAAIAIGIAFLARGILVKVRVDSRNRLPVQYEHMFDPAEARVGVTGKLVAGCFGIGFGTLAVLGLPAVGFAVVAFGVVLVLGAHDQPEFARQAPDPDRAIEPYTRGAIRASMWVTAIAGTCASILGLGVVMGDQAPALLFVLVAAFIVGIAQIVAGLALAIRFGRHGAAPVSA